MIFFSAYMLADGVFAIISAVRAIRRKQDRWGLVIFEGLLNIVVGIAAFLWPGLTVVVFVWLIAAWAIVSGGLMTAAGFQLNSDHGRWWLVLGGLLSLAYGVLPYHHAVDRRDCAHLVAGSLRPRFRRRAGGILVQASVATA